KPDLGAAVQAAGFHVTRLHYFDVAGVLPWWFLFRVLKLRAVNAGQARQYDRLVVPIMRRLEAWIRPPFGKNLVLLARKA
ncbi:MAG: hypothetical protein J0L75_15340, partial [Spirochaetes bacterium]|nr:hypothetical protein [Spirochaetota bacterium]